MPDVYPLCGRFLLRRPRSVFGAGRTGTRALMYIGIGAVVLVLVILALIYFLRGSTV